jgi:hypothetical protein
MRRQNSRGGAVLEFSLIVGTMVSLFLGTFGIGINLIHGLEIVQLARDAGHMFARGIAFSSDSPGNIQILNTIGKTVGLKTDDAAGSTAVLYLSKVTYVDNPTCIAGGQAAGCHNFGQWVHVQKQLSFGNTTIFTSGFGNPNSLTAGSDGSIAPSIYVTNDGARCTPCSTLGINSGAIGVPSRESIYISEAAAKGFPVPGFISGAAVPTFLVF